ncbi:MAG: hypothetical protein M5T61_19675 [Acidimicrobiia bacterium]|nr:hypothetical protein [Acidimicrobiia bacterium]
MAAWRAWVLADQIDGFLNERRIPSTLTTELAIARRDVDAVYFSRRRYLARITDRLGPELDEATGGNAPPKLSRAIKEALGGDAAVFESEAVLFLEASVVRARLTTTLAHVMSAGGDIADAMDLVEATRLSIYADLTEYGRTLRGLSRWEAGLFGELRGHDDFLDVLNKLATITDNELLPKLGEPAQPGYVELSRNADSTWTAGAA